jgi:hypothetical protein
MLKTCLRWGYLLACFSFLALIVAFFLYGQRVSLPAEPGISLLYKAGFIFATPLVESMGIDSLFVYIMIAGFFQVLIAFGLGVALGLVLHVTRQ